MGYAIEYCSSCRSQLRGPDFQNGRAIRIGVEAFCKKCIPAELYPSPIDHGTVSAQPAPASSPPEVPLATGSVRVSETPASNSKSTGRINVLTSRAYRFGSRTTWPIFAAGVAVGAIALLGYFLAEGGPQASPPRRALRAATRG